MEEFLFDENDSPIININKKDDLRISSNQIINTENVDDILKEIYGKMLTKNSVESYFSRIKNIDTAFIRCDYHYSFSKKPTQKEIKIASKAEKKRLRERIEILFKLFDASIKNEYKNKIDDIFLASLEIKNLFDAENIICEIHKLADWVNALYENINSKQYDKFFISNFVYNWLNKKWVYSAINGKENIKTIIESFQITNEKLPKEPQKEDIFGKLKQIIELLNENKIINDILHIDSIIPQTFIITKDKATNNLQKIEGAVDLIVAGKGEKAVKTKVILTYEETNLTYSKKINSYDKIVINTITTLNLAGNEVITPQMIFRTMNGQTTGGISKQMIEKIKQSIDKCIKVRIYIDYTEEAKMRNKKKDIKKATLDGYLLDLHRVTVEAGGEIMEGYKILTEPILYTYANTSNQVIRIPIEVLNTNTITNNTENVIIIREYLLTQIEWLKGPQGYKRNKVITYKAIYEELGLTEIKKDKAFDIRKQIITLLDFWKKETYIKSYEKVKTGVSIEV